jgi:hypothetical protein
LVSPASEAAIEPTPRSFRISPQLEVQAALASDRPGLAQFAAMAIGRCLHAEGVAVQLRERIGKVAPGQVPPFVRKLLEDIDADVRECQALDAFSRSQWNSMLHRGAEEGDTGTAAMMVGFLGLDDPTQGRAIAEVLPYLRRDARRCNQLSLIVLAGTVRYNPQATTAAERFAIWQIRREAEVARAGAESRPPYSYPEEPEEKGDPDEAQQIASEIRTHCWANEAAKSAGTK